MALKLNLENKDQDRRHFVRPGVRLFLTADGQRLVNADNPEARTLYCTEHKEVPRAQFERLLENTRRAEQCECDDGEQGEGKDSGGEQGSETKSQGKRGKGK